MGSRAAPAPVDIGSGDGAPDYFSTGIHDAPAWPGEPLPEIPGGGMTEPASAPEPIESTTTPAPFGTGESVMSKVTQVIDNRTRPVMRIEDEPPNWL